MSYLQSNIFANKIKLIEMHFKLILIVLLFGMSKGYSQSQMKITVKSEYPSILRFIYKLPCDSVFIGQNYFDFILKSGPYQTYTIAIPDSVAGLRAFFICSNVNKIGFKQITITNNQDSLTFYPGIILGDWRWANYLNIYHNFDELLITTRISHRGENPTAFFIINVSQKELQKLNFSTTFSEGLVSIRFLSRDNSRFYISYGRNKAWIVDHSGISIPGSTGLIEARIRLKTNYIIKYFEILVIPSKNSEIEIISISFVDSNLSLKWNPNKIIRDFSIIDPNRKEININTVSLAKIQSSIVLSLKHNLVDPMIRITKVIILLAVLLLLFVLNKNLLRERTFIFLNVQAKKS